MSSEQLYSSVMVGLDLTDMDDVLIDYSAMLSRVCDISTFYFVHVVKDLEVPDAVLEQFPNLKSRKPIDEAITDKLQKKVETAFAELDIHTEVIVREGHPMEKFTRLVKVKNVDLILFGRKKSLTGSGIVSSKIARNSHCSLLLVPEDPPKSISKILVPVDFSEHSKLSMSTAQYIAEQTQGQLEALHIYEVPSGYHTTGKSYEEFADIMRGHAERDYANFLKKGGFNESIPCSYRLHNGDKTNELINEHAHEIGADLIVVGSRGRTKAAVVLLGSMAEKLAYIDNDTPLMIAKKKGEIMGFLEAIMKI